MEACEGLSDAERRAAHVRAGEVATAIGGHPTVRDLIDALAEIRERKLDGADEYSVVDVVDRLERAPTTRDIADVELDRLQELGQEAVQTSWKEGDPVIVPSEHHYRQFPESRPIQEPQDGPNAAALPQPADASGTGSDASPAASGGDLESAYGADLDAIAAEQFDVRRTPGETDSSLRAFLRAKQRADDDLSGCRWVNPVATATDPAADREALARVAPALHRSSDLTGAWRGIAGSQAVEAGGRFPAVDISDAVND
jgi:hypothetical protein